jgi:two-component system, LytTR family, sensor kinase
MGSLNAALLINLLGFTVGVALYSLLLAMVVRHRRTSGSDGVNALLLTTSVLGLIWNLGELYAFVQKDFGFAGMSPFLTAAVYSALGFLPSVVVHSARSDEAKVDLLTSAAYGLSGFAAILHFGSAYFSGSAPSALALQTLTVGAVAMAAVVLLFNFRQTLEKKAIWASALLIFAVSAFHLSGRLEGNSWIVELAAHQSSLPLALAILYQNYRFAFADLFLKRAISLILLALVAFALYVFVAAPLLRYHETHDRNDVQAVTLILTLWIATALIYPALHKFAVWLVDKIILHRADYEKLQLELARAIESVESIDEVLDTIAVRLADVLTAEKFDWTENYGPNGSSSVSSVHFEPNFARIRIPTAEMPSFSIDLTEFHGGRRLLSDETIMLDAVSLSAARRIDALRVSHERCQQEFREEEFSKLAAEAQLTALRSQINPHFLFNALTTIGYLIQTAPDTAFQTLLHLTKLLRSVLSSTGEFCTLGEEIRLIESYLDIERARFEERLLVKIAVPKDLENLSVPSLILQPLVENAIKHGISENKKGGEVRISAMLQNTAGGPFLKLTVFDTGAGSNTRHSRESTGVGLRNIRERLNSYYDEHAAVELKIDGTNGTRAEISLPVRSASQL